MFKRFKRMIDLYDNLIYTDTVLNSTLDFVVPKHTDGNVEIDNLAMYSRDKVTFFYTIQSLPRMLLIDFKTRLRQCCKAGVTLAFLSKEFGHTILWDSSEMRSRLRILSEHSTEVNDRDINAFNLHSNLSEIESNKWTQESLEYLSEASVSRGRALLRVNILLMVTGRIGEDFDNSIATLLADSEQLGIKLTRVLYNIPDILGYFAPSGNIINNSVDSQLPAFVLPDEILSRFNTYSQGTIGVDGVYFGTDIYSCFPVLKRVKSRTTSAENWLYTAETGGGKGYTLKPVLLQLLALGYNGTIMDIEGYEYSSISDFLGDEYSVVKINMGEGAGSYFDPVEIATFADLNENPKQMSINSTLNWISTLLGKLSTEDDYTEIVLNDAVSKAYFDKGVTEDRDTWGNSRGMTLHTIYDTIKMLSEQARSKEYRDTASKMVATLSKYFEQGGTRSEMFKNRIKTQDIEHADLVICSFGMAGKSQGSVDDTQMALMQLGASQISYQRSLFSKMSGKFNFKVWEEFQRWGKFPGSDVTLGTALTGGRKLGDINIIVTNVLKELLDDDRFGIFASTTSFLCGAIADSEVREEFCRRMTIPQMLPELDKISTVRDSDEVQEDLDTAESDYEHAFLCGLDKSKYTVLKMLLPDSISKTSLFETGV